MRLGAHNQCLVFDVSGFEFDEQARSRLQLGDAQNLRLCLTNSAPERPPSVSCIKRYNFSFTAATGYSGLFLTSHDIVTNVCDSTEKTQPDVDFESVRFRAKSGSWNNPSSQSIA